MEIDDKVELLAVWRALLEAKFHPNPIDRDIFVSPIVSDLAERIFNVLSKENLNEWEAWREVDLDRKEVKVLISNLSNSHVWRQLEKPEKEETVRIALSPFKMSDEEASILRERVDELSNNV